MATSEKLFSVKLGYSYPSLKVKIIIFFIFTLFSFDVFSATASLFVLKHDNGTLFIFTSVPKYVTITLCH